MPRQKAFGKCKFTGNMHSCKQQNVQETVANRSSSSKNIDVPAIEEDASKYVERNSNITVNISVLSNLLNLFSLCKNCGSSGTFDVLEEYRCRKGLSTSLMFLCKACECSASGMTSKISKSLCDINVHFVYAMCCIGKGNSAAQTLCSILDLPPPPSKFQKYKYLLPALSEVAEMSVSQAVKETVDENEGNSDITAAFDGTWQKRGHTSLNGVCATSLTQGKVIDFECFSKFCFKCKNAKYPTQDCEKNFDGYSGGMEVEGVMNIFQRSETTRGVTYINYLCDGDSKGFNKIYVDKVNIEKLECIAHVQKRVGTTLRALRTELKNTKLSDGKSISGRGRLSDIEISRLQNYYGLAIRRNCSKSIDDMHKSVWAIYFHKLSPDEKRQHGFCPVGADSWCGYNKSNVCGTSYVHKNVLPEAVMTAIKPVFRSLSDRKLLSRCLHGRTQNPNESFNSCLWERLPKTVFVGHTTLKMEILDTIICFNDGSYSRSKVLEALSIEPGYNMRNSLKKMDCNRVRKAELSALNLIKCAKSQKKN